MFWTLNKKGAFCWGHIWPSEQYVAHSACSVSVTCDSVLSWWWRVVVKHSDPCWPAVSLFHLFLFLSSFLSPCPPFSLPASCLNSLKSAFAFFIFLNPLYLLSHSLKQENVTNLLGRMTVYLIFSFPFVEERMLAPFFLFCFVWWPLHLRRRTVILALSCHRVSSSLEALDTLNLSLTCFFMVVFVQQLVKLRIMRAALQWLSVFAFTFMWNISFHSTPFHFLDSSS